MVIVKILGIERLQAKFKAISEIDMSPAINKATAVVEGSAKAKAQVDSGLLRNSIHPEKARIVGKGEYQGRVYTNLEYAPYVEFGTGAKGSGTYPYSVEGLSLTYRMTPWAFTDDSGKTWWTNGQVAQPFMYPALSGNKTRIKRLLETEYRKLLRSKALGGK